MAITEVTKIKTTGIDHVALHVSDVERSRDFYINVLGMTEHHGGGNYCFLKCGNQIVGLFGAGGALDQSGVELSHMAFNVDTGTYDEVKASLEAHGIAVHGRSGDPRCIYFDDPDGHRLQLMVRRD
jgi:catechol 2,3-dioxygenase-like lactoylglutathione lyase family enzyme